MIAIGHGCCVLCQSDNRTSGCSAAASPAVADVSSLDPGGVEAHLCSVRMEDDNGPIY